MRDSHRLEWNQGQTALRRALEARRPGPEAQALFLAQHIPLHANPAGFSFEEEVWRGLPPEAARREHGPDGHSIAWCLWHLARIEDMTMNVLVAGRAQRFHEADWFTRLGTAFRDTGNAMRPEQARELAQSVDLDALRAYRLEVGLRTREIVAALVPEDYARKTPAGRLHALLADGSLDPACVGLAEYWGGLTVAGLLLMPPTRHAFVHLNECVQIRKRLKI